MRKGQTRKKLDEEEVRRGRSQMRKNVDKKEVRVGICQLSSQSCNLSHGVMFGKKNRQSNERLEQEDAVLELKNMLEEQCIRIDGHHTRKLLDEEHVRAIKCQSRSTLECYDDQIITDQSRKILEQEMSEQKDVEYDV